MREPVLSLHGVGSRVATADRRSLAGKDHGGPVQVEAKAKRMARLHAHWQEHLMDSTIFQTQICWGAAAGSSKKQLVPIKQKNYGELVQLEA